MRGLFGGPAREARRAYAPQPRGQGRGRFDTGPRTGLAGLPMPPVPARRAADGTPQREIFILARPVEPSRS